MAQITQIYKLLDWIDKDKLDWYYLCENQSTGAIQMLEQNIDKINWH
jgi:hypothetical protein